MPLPFSTPFDYNQTMTSPPDFFSTAGHLLIAMPLIGDPRFHRGVVFIAAHDRGGAMGFNLTLPRQTMMLDNMMEQTNIPHDDLEFARTPVMDGGPVEQERGFILHSSDYHRKETVFVNDDFYVTSTIDSLKDIANGNGPRHYIFILGYSGWQPGQIENELRGNSWLTMPATPQLIFQIPAANKWDVALNHMGVNPAMLSDVVGHG